MQVWEATRVLLLTPKDIEKKQEVFSFILDINSKVNLLV